MTRRKEESLSSILVRKTWYWSVIFSAVLYVLMRYGFPMMFPPEASSEPAKFGDFSSFGSMIANTLSRLAPLAWVFCLAIPFSLWHSYRKKRNLNKQRSVDSIKELTWREFEWLVSEAFRRKGWQVTESLDRGADGGYDLVLTPGNRVQASGKLPVPKFPGQRILVQCKQWRTNKVGAPKVRELFGVVSAEKAMGGIFVTSGTYTRDAIEFVRGLSPVAHGKPGTGIGEAASPQFPIQLIDGPALLQLIKGVQKQSQQDHSELSPTPATAALQKQSTPSCPKCGAPTVLRTARKGPNTGQQFYGCSNFPACRGTLPVGNITKAQH